MRSKDKVFTYARFISFASKQRSIHVKAAKVSIKPASWTKKAGVLNKRFLRYMC